MTSAGNGNTDNSRIIGQILQARLTEINRVRQYDAKKDGDNFPTLTMSPYCPAKIEPYCFTVEMCYSKGGDGAMYNSIKNVGHHHVGA